MHYLKLNALSCLLKTIFLKHKFSVYYNCTIDKSSMVYEMFLFPNGGCTCVKFVYWSLPAVQLVFIK